MISFARTLLLSAAWIVPVAAQAQLANPEPTPQSTSVAPSTTPEAADIIVTATSRPRVALDTPLAITSVSQEAIARLNVSSQADILNSVPTIKADAGGGEVASNVFVRGLPSGGQYQFTPLMYDGVPVLSTFGLNSSAFDVYFRNDLGLERLEFVRGGVSNLFGPGSVAGLINYITDTGGDRLRLIAQGEIAERDRYRGDLAVSGPLGGGLYFAASGYYRNDKGPIRTNLDTDGFQVRGSLKYAPDDTGSITLSGQYIDDKVQFYLPIPLDGRTRQRIAGNDGRIVYSVQNEFDPNLLAFNLPGRRFVSRINDGVQTRGGRIALLFDKKLGDSGFGINGKFKYSKYAHRFGLWSDGDGVINVPETLQSFLTNRNLGNLANAQFTFVGGGTVPANYLLFANRFTDRERPVRDYTGELNLTASATTGALEHTFTLGGFYANARARDFNATTTYLAEFNNQPRLVNLVVTNPTTGAQTIVSRSGLLNAGAGYVNNLNKAKRYAIYAADQIEAGRFNFDIGGRYEWFRGYTQREIGATVITDATTPNLSTALRDVVAGTGNYLRGNVRASSWAVAAGALYKVTDRVSFYANASRGFFFPEIRAVAFIGTTPSSYEPEIIKQAEAGIKVSQPQFSFTVAGLYTRLKNRRQVNQVNGPNGSFIEQVNLVATRSFGVEATFDLKLLRSLRFAGNLTLQNAKYTFFQSGGVTRPAIIGNDVERQPDFLYNAGLYYDDGALDASFFTNYTDDNFTANNNAIRLNGWHIVNLDAGYKIPVGEGKLRVGVNVFNLFKNAAVTEGSPRQDVNQVAGGQYFVGRPVLPRRVTGRVTLSF